MAMKKSLAAACLVFLAHSLPIHAEESPLPPPVAAVAAVLELDNVQVAALLTMIQTRDAALRPLAEELQRHQRALDQLLGTPDAGAVTVGQLVLEMRALTAKIGEVRVQANAQFEQLLTPGQIAKLQHIREAASIQEVVQVFRVAGLV